MKASIFPDHGYPPYPVLFDRTTPWADKEPLLKGMKQPEAKAPAPPAKKKPKKKTQQ